MAPALRLYRLDVILLAALTALAFGLRVAGLGDPFQAPAGQVFDERIFADAACRDIAGQDYLDPEPPLSKLLIAGGIEVGGLWLRYPAQPPIPNQPRCGIDPAGYGTWGWRLASLAFGTALIPLLYLFALSLWPNRLFAALSALLMTFDGLEFVQSRLALLDIFPIFFVVLALLLFQIHRHAQSPRAFYISGLAVGLAVGLGAAAKWTALSALGVVVAVLAGGWLLRRVRVTVNGGQWSVAGQAGSVQRGPARTADRAAFYAVVLLLVPLAIYLASYARYLAIPHVIPNPAVGTCDFSQVISFQPGFDPAGWLREIFVHDRWAYVYHTCQTRIDPNGSPWFTWPLLLHPVTYYSADIASSHGQLKSVVWNLGNPLIWWASIPALAYCAVTAIRSRSYPAALIVLGFLCAWLPFSQIGRGLYLYHMLGGLPFMVLAVAFALTSIRSVVLRAEFGRFHISAAGPRLIAAYVVLVIAAFIYFYPLWTGMPITPDAYRDRIWLNLPLVSISWF